MEEPFEFLVAYTLGNNNFFEASVSLLNTCKKEAQM